MSRSLLIALISTDYPPLRTSAAVQLRDLALQIAAQGHRPIVIVPSSLSGKNWVLETLDGIEVLRVAAPETRSPSLVRRAIAELWLPFAMLRNIRRSPLRAQAWDLLVWYSPPIFFGPLIWALRKASGARALSHSARHLPGMGCRSRCIAQGAFIPVLQGGRRLAVCARRRHRCADAASNIAYLANWQTPRRRVEVLHNWLAVTPDVGCSIRVQETALAGRKILVYIGNMGIAQGMDILIELVEDFRDRQDLGFLFVGRGRDFENLMSEKAARGLDNVLFFNEIDFIGNSRLAGAVPRWPRRASSEAQDAPYPRKICFICPVWPARPGAGQCRDGYCSPDRGARSRKGVCREFAGGTQASRRGTFTRRGSAFVDVRKGARAGSGDVFACRCRAANHKFSRRRSGGVALVKRRSWQHRIPVDPLALHPYCPIAHGCGRNLR